MQTLEKANEGKTVIEKFETHASKAGYAIILLTPDDEGGRGADDLQKRARQNVILELGYFIGRLGRNRVCAMKKGDLELPSNIAGVVSLPIDEGDGWKIALARELKQAGFNLDANKLL